MTIIHNDARSRIRDTDAIPMYAIAGLVNRDLAGNTPRSPRHHQHKMTPAQRQLPGVVAVHPMEVTDMGHGRGRPPARVLTAGRQHDHRLGHSDPSDLMTRLGKRVQVIGECWALDGNLDEYVSVKCAYGRMNAHRFVYLEVHGDVLDSDMHVHHECQHPGCIRPDHLTAMSNSDHMKLHRQTPTP